MIVFKWFLVVSLSVCGLLSGGCTTLPAGGGHADRALPFEFMGRVLVHSNERAFSANTRWVHAREFDEIWLLTPTGQAVAQMREDASGATVTGIDQVVYRGARVESLTQRALGWEFPLSRMQYWVRGAAAPGAPFEIKERDAAGKPRVILQEGWTISYEYYPPGTNEGVPRRMEISGATQSLRLVIDTWGRPKPEGE